MGKPSETEWLSLQQASEMLGVHPATLRAWSDRGRIATRRTPGGHRRFSRADLQAWLASQRRGKPEAEIIVQSALGHMRLEMGRAETRNAAWMTRFNEDMRQRYREMGRQLLGLLMRYMTSPDQRADALEQACAIGRQYGVIARDNGLSLTDAVEAVLFFHSSLTDSVIQMASSLSPGDNVDWASTQRQVTDFVNDVLLAMIEIYTGEASA